MIFAINWEQFKQRYFVTSNTIFLRETDKIYEFFTTEGIIIIKTTVKKASDDFDNQMFSEKNFMNKVNLVKIEEILKKNTATREAYQIPETKVEEFEDDAFIKKILNEDGVKRGSD